MNTHAHHEPHTENHDQHAGHDSTTAHHDHAAMHGSGLNKMAASATLHCLTGCAIGEVLGLMIGTAIGLSTGATIALAVSLAFLFGFALSTLPLLGAGLTLGAALKIVVAADTLSIATMELVDNAVMAAIPGAMDAGLVNPIFWIGMSIALTIAYGAAYPVNRYLLTKGKGHALTHQYHEGHGDHGHQASHGDPGDPGDHAAQRRRVPTINTVTLAVAIAAFMLGGLVVSIADELESDNSPVTHSSSTTNH